MSARLIVTWVIFLPSPDVVAVEMFALLIFSCIPKITDNEPSGCHKSQNPPQVGVGSSSPTHF